MKRHFANSFDLDVATKMTGSFARSCNLPCKLLNPEGTVLYRENFHCDLCHLCRQTLPEGQNCRRSPLSEVSQAERLGGRYISACDAGMGWISVPIIVNGSVSASLETGPVMLLDIDNYLAGYAENWPDASRDKIKKIIRTIQRFPQRSPSQMNDISMQLVATSLYIGDTGRILIESRKRAAQQQEIGLFIQKLKQDNAERTYPLEKEHSLVMAITEGNLERGKLILNDLIGHMLYCSGGQTETVRIRCGEILVHMSRAAIGGGAERESALLLNQRFISEMLAISNVDDFWPCLMRALEQYTSMVFNKVNVKHKESFYKAINYMRQNISSKVTLQEVAEFIGFSPSYFSRIFKEEMGISFANYLSRLRIEESQLLLVASNLSISEICVQVGIEDQSYFTNVFRSITGVSPGRFRERQKRVDYSKEREYAEDQ